MAFQIKDFRSIAASMINWMRSVQTKVTDFNVGSVARTMVEAPAVEIDELYQQMFTGLKEAIPVSVYLTFGFERIPAEAASGLVRFSTGGELATQAIIIPIQSEVRAPSAGLVYVTTIEARILPGQSYVDVLVACRAPGTVGNVGVGAISEMVSPVAGVSVVENPAPFTNGRDAESEEDRRIRFQEYVSTLARGTKAAIVYGAKTARIQDQNGLIIEYVAHASVLEPWVTDDTQPVSLVEVYIHNGASATSGALVARTQRVIDGYIDEAGESVPGWKAAGVIVEVIAASDKVVNVVGEVTVQTNVDEAEAIAAANEAIRSYIQSLDVGESVIFSELIAIVKRDVPGVYNVVLSEPAGDVACAADEKAIPGTVSLT